MAVSCVVLDENIGEILPCFRSRSLGYARLHRTIGNHHKFPSVDICSEHDPLLFQPCSDIPSVVRLFKVTEDSGSLEQFHDETKKGQTNAI